MVTMSVVTCDSDKMVMECSWWCGGDVQCDVVDIVLQLMFSLTNQPLGSLLIMPVQRIPRYTLLLQVMINTLKITISFGG